MNKEQLKKVLDNMIIGDCWTGEGTEKEEIGSCIKYKNGETLYFFKNEKENTYKLIKTINKDYKEFKLSEDDVLNLIDFIHNAINEVKEEGPQC